jgi:hypothetical protein
MRYLLDVSAKVVKRNSRLVVQVDVKAISIFRLFFSFVTI